MKSLLLRLLQGFLVLLVLSLLVALVVPWAQETFPPSPELTGNVQAPDLQSSRTPPVPLAPEVVFGLFMKRSLPSAPRPAAIPDAPKPVEAPWLVFLGFYSSGEGDAYYVMKDTRSGRVITISARGVSAAGWSVVAVEDKRIIVHKDADTYVVYKR